MEKVFVGVYDTFVEASEFASDIAKEYAESVFISRSDAGWVIMASSLVAEKIELANLQSYLEETEEYDNSLEEYDGEIEVLFSDLEDDREDWARSNEDGWFYEN